MFVKNNEARVHIIGVTVKRDGKTEAHDLALKPGVQEVKDELWEAAKLNQLVRWHLTEGNLEELVPIAADPAKTPAATLKDVRVKDAEKLIADTFDRELLLKWAAEDQRTTVQAAIKAQLELIELAGDKEEDDPAARGGGDQE